MRNRLNFMSFWAINDALDIRRMERQLEQMKAYGLTGTVFHPRYYPGRPEYMGREYLDMLSEVILYAKKLHMDFWIYDENGWPSGSAGGRVLARFPESRCRWLQFENGEIKWRETKGINTFDREEMRYFIHVTYDGYRNGLDKEAFAYVTGFFSDEVGFPPGHGVSISAGGVPWCEEAELLYRRRYQEDLRLELLFADGPEARQVKCRYWQILTDILAESFYQPISDWCERYGKRYTAHLKGEETLFFQTSCSGSALWNLRRVNTLAVDALERYPGNHYYPRIASSLVRQFSDGESLCEALGGSGWGLTPENLENYVDWLARCGINNFVFHLWQYNRSSASVRDWPPNIPMGLTWRDLLPDVLDRLKSRWDGRDREPRILLAAPVRGVMSTFDPRDAQSLNEHNGAGTPPSESGRISLSFGEFSEQCHEMGMDYDISEERIIEDCGRIEGNQLRIGNALYDAVIAGDGCLWEDGTLLHAMDAAGILRRQEEFTWKFVRSGRNQFPLLQGENRIPLSFQAPVYGMEIRVLDPMREICVMGKPIEISRRDESGIYYALPNRAIERAVREGCLSVTLTTDGEAAPIAFLTGDFLVKCETPYQEIDHAQVISDGGFYLANQRPDISCCDLIEAGYPFCGASVTVTCTTFAGAEGILRLGAVQADGARVWVDGTDCGFIWGPAWEVSGLPEGLHEMTVELFPSTFNTYGPHHHMDGDRPLVSPEQYTGRKNFADRETAPENTLVPQWHLRHFGIGRKILS